MKGSDFVLDSAHLLYYKCHKINLNRSESYIDSLGFIKNEHGQINLINKIVKKCFQYAATVALIHEQKFENILKGYQK